MRNKHYFISTQFESPNCVDRLYESGLAKIMSASDFLNTDHCIKIKKYNLFIARYPLDYSVSYIKQLTKKTRYSICIIQDIKNLIGNNDAFKYFVWLFRFKFLIIYSKQFGKQLIDKGYKGRIIYINTIIPLIKNMNFENSILYGKSISIVGNLRDKLFINSLDFIKDINFRKIRINLFGTETTRIYLTSNIFYNGELINKLNSKMIGSYGLIWYGDDLNSCNTLIEECYEYQSYKELSFYIAINIPVIVYKKSKIAKFVKENRVGLVVNSLKEIRNNILETNYKCYFKNITLVKNRIPQLNLQTIFNFK